VVAIANSVASPSYTPGSIPEPPVGYRETVDQAAARFAGAVRNRAPRSVAAWIDPEARIIDDDIPLFRDHPVVRSVVALTVTLSKDLAITIERGLYGRPEVGESCVDVTVCHGNVPSAPLSSSSSPFRGTQGPYHSRQ
jgi:hypothetical protein